MEDADKLAEALRWLERACRTHKGACAELVYKPGKGWTVTIFLPQDPKGDSLKRFVSDPHENTPLGHAIRDVRSAVGCAS